MKFVLKMSNSNESLTLFYVILNKLQDSSVKDLNLLLCKHLM